MEQLSEEQKKALDVVSSGQNLFLTGAGGTGKTFLLNLIIEQLRERYSHKSVFVTATTGVAALNLAGSTLHSFAGFGISINDPQKMLKDCKTFIRTRWRQTRALVIDEVSMLDAKTYDVLEEFARGVRQSNLPWGGIQLVLSGDFFQLPPVTPGEKPAFCFQGERWRHSDLVVIRLVRVFRQHGDPEFASILAEIRRGEVSDRAKELLASCVRPPPPGEILPTILHSHRANSQEENQQFFDSLCSSPIHQYESKDRGDEKYRSTLDRSCQAPKTLYLRKGAQVMLLCNIPDLQLVNGSRGVVKSLDENAIKVDFFGHSNNVGDEKLISVSVPVKRFEYRLGDKVLATRDQFPLQLAWSSTIHKAQGLSLDFVEVVVNEAFAEGQVYVALSRATSLKGLFLREPLDPSRVRANQEVIKFYETL